MSGTGVPCRMGNCFVVKRNDEPFAYVKYENQADVIIQLFKNAWPHNKSEWTMELTYIEGVF